MNVDTEKETCFFEEYFPNDLEKVIDTHHKVIEYQKKKITRTYFLAFLLLMIWRTMTNLADMQVY